MLVVVVDTSTAAVTAALVAVDPPDAAGEPDAAGGRPDAGVRLIAERRHIDARAHGELLAPAIQATLTSAGVAPGELTAIVAGLGPGPYTGLRVGLATAAAMAQALAVPAYGVCSLDGIGAGTPGRCLVATDARRHEVYWALYAEGVRVHGPAVNRPGDLPAILADQGLSASSAAGDGALRYADLLGLPTMAEHRFPDPVALAQRAAGRVRDRAGGQILTPLYLRRPDAVEPGTPKLVTR